MLQESPISDFQTKASWKHLLGRGIYMVFLTRADVWTSPLFRNCSSSKDSARHIINSLPRQGSCIFRRTWTWKGLCLINLRRETPRVDRPSQLRLSARREAGGERRTVDESERKETIFNSSARPWWTNLQWHPGIPIGPSHRLTAKTSGWCSKLVGGKIILNDLFAEQQFLF